MNKQEYDKQNSEWVSYKELSLNRKETNNKYRMGNPSKYLLGKCRRRAFERQLEFNLDLDDFVVPDLCPILKVPFDYTIENYCPSVDRLDNTKGYIKGNIIIMTTLANRMKATASLSEWKQFCLGSLDFIESLKIFDRKA